MSAYLSGLARTASLNKVNNDTGRVAFCGPYVLSAITGYSISKVEDEIRRYRAVPDHREPSRREPEGKAVVKGTCADEVAAALAAFGYRMQPVAGYTRLPRQERPTVWAWMQKPRNAWAHYILAIHKGKEGHWILIKGVKICDTYTEGKWTFVVDGPHRAARIMEIFEVKRALE